MAAVAVVAVEAAVVLAAGREVAVFLDLPAGLRLDHQVACPEHRDHRSAAPHRLIDRVLELHVPTWELQVGRDLQYSRELDPKLPPDRDWPGAEASVLDHRHCRRRAPPPGSPIVRALRYRGLEVAAQDLVFPIREPGFRNERPIVRKLWKTAEAV